MYWDFSRTGSNVGKKSVKSSRTGLVAVVHFGAAISS